MGRELLSVVPPVMRLCRAVPKILAKSSVPPRLPLYKNCPLRTRSKSTLPQLLIPFNFNSRISNTYKKTRGRAPSPVPKFCNSSLPARRSCVHAGIRAIPFRSWVYFTTCGHPGWGGTSFKPNAIQCSLPSSASLRATGHGSPPVCFDRRAKLR